MIALLGLVIGQVSAQKSDMRHIDSLLSRSKHTEALRFAMNILSERPDDMALRHKVEIYLRKWVMPEGQRESTSRY